MSEQDNVIELKRPHTGLTPKEVLEEALLISDDLECIVVVGKYKDQDVLLLGYNKGDLHEQIGLCELAKFNMMIV